MMLQIDKIDVYYGDVQALVQVSLELDQNECVAVIGSNGAGKTTLIKTIAGLLTPKRGRVLFDGEEITALPPYEIAKRGIAMAHEGRRLFPEMTVLENLEMGSYLQRAKRNIAQNLDLIFDLFPVLKERSLQRAGRLSGGEQQMLAIARSLMTDPRILMIDEASLGLAPVLIQRLWRILRELKNRRLTILLVDQNVAMALSIADRGYVLENGRMVLEGESDELLASDDLKKRYLGI